ncbi:hypothetical protein LOTGIDRAFT_229193 [Lottia gigantea]|uniref:TPM domain-containing protein n=1 Tax=Lottia gigantea TaxID=225164 RepID=V4A7W2_LOTGI|nr:hypothetical protein LOTGIDRAFT_229193 [Lottia gigantea]ESO89341.1 hypothetical protein LOTGIDRAFT_229193 [Lottia gigantea]
MMMKIIFAVTLWNILSVFGQLDPDQMPSEWTPEQFPNPQRNSQACGLRNERGYVCDPNRILSEEEIDALNWLLLGLVQNDTHCPCSVWACEQKKQGYSVGIAIVKKLKLPTRTMRPLDQARAFAHYLETSQWHFGRCEEGIVVLYSQQDGALQFMAGQTASQIVTNDVARAIGDQVAYNFRNGEPHHGLYELVLLLRSVLNGNKMYALAPSAEALHGGAESLTVVISTLLLTLTSFFILS